MSSYLNIEWTHLREVLNAYADDVIAKAREYLEDNNTNATKTLYNTLGEDREITIEDDYISVKIGLEDYALYVEFGTGPSHLREEIGGPLTPEPRQQYWPKIGPLKEWVQNKPGVPKEDGFAYAVREKIHKEGATPHPFLTPAIEYVLPRYEELIGQAVEQDVNDFLENNMGL